MSSVSLSDIHARVDRDAENLRKTNTVKAINPKLLEWKEYCDYNHGGDTKVTPEKVFTFLFYQAYREKKPSGGKYGNACSTGINKRRKMTKSLKGYKN